MATPPSTSNMLCAVAVPIDTPFVPTTKAFANEVLNILNGKKVGPEDFTNDNELSVFAVMRQVCEPLSNSSPGPYILVPLRSKAGLEPADLFIQLDYQQKKPPA